MSSPLTETPDGLQLALRVTPKAAANAIGAVRGGRLLVKVTAVPEDGKATAAVLKLVAKAFDIPNSRIEVLAGTTNREKRLLLRGLDLSEVPSVLRDLLAVDNQV